MHPILTGGSIHRMVTSSDVSRTTTAILSILCIDVNERRVRMCDHTVLI